MANGGWYGTKEEWERIEAPLKQLDPELDRFARKHNLTVTKNHKDWPERSIEWETNVRCLMQLFLSNESALTLDLWICAFQDRGTGRYLKKELMRKEAPASDLKDSLFDLLETGKRKLELWNEHPEEFEFATTLSRPPDWL